MYINLSDLNEPETPTIHGNVEAVTQAVARFNKKIRPFAPEPTDWREFARERVFERRTTKGLEVSQYAF
jgi:hypothetical protein